MTEPTASKGTGGPAFEEPTPLFAFFSFVLLTAIVLILAGGATGGADARLLPGPVLAGLTVIGVAAGVVGFIATYRTAQSSRRSRTAMRESEARFREIAETVRNVFWVSDPATERVLYVSPAFEEVWGAPRALAYDSPRRLAMIHADDRRAVVESMLRGGDAQRDLEYRIFRPDGEMRWIHGRSFPVRDSTGRIVRVVGVAEDITERKLAEDAVLLERTRYAELARATQDLTWELDLVAGRIRWNDAIHTAWGYPPDHVVTSLDWWDERVHPDDRVRVGESLTRAIDDPEATTWSSEYRFSRADGTFLIVFDRGYLVRDESGRAVRAVGSMADMTERKRLEEQLRESQKMDAVGRLAGGIAHDFNNLLTVIQGQAQLLGHEVPESSTMREEVDAISAAAERAAALTQQLLAFSRRQMVEPRLLEVNAVVAGMGRMVERLIGEDIQLVTELDPALGVVRADRSQLEQVILNLVVNARDAMPDGGRLLIRTANRDIVHDPGSEGRRLPARAVVLSVSDTGTGIDAATLPHIFEPFFTTKAAGKGTGLGLSTVYGIVEQNGGVVRVESEPGRGTTFHVFLPRVAGTPGAEEAKPAAAAGGNSETILVVEDNAALRVLVTKVLGRAGYRVLEAHDGAMALNIARTHEDTIDLVITDMVMPGISGLELVRALRDARPQIEVLCVSGYTEERFRQSAEWERDRFMPKPFTPEALLARARALLDARTADVRTVAL